MSILPKFEPKYFEEILQDMVNFIKITAPELTDWNEGSRIRSILEAAALEDDEQYHQAVELLRLWNLGNLRGRDLDERLAEWGLSRLPALHARGELVFMNTGLVSSFLVQDVVKGDTSIKLYSTAAFLPTNQAPYTVRIGEGTSTVEDVTVSANDETNGVLTVSALVNDHKKNERVSLVSGSVITIPAGTVCRTLQGSDVVPISASTVEDVVIDVGNYYSSPAVAVVDTPGKVGNISKNMIREFAGSPPFDGAEVYNPAPFVGGRDEETDKEFLSRARNYIQSLARCTVVALEHLMIGETYTDENSNIFRLISAKVIERYVPNSAEDYVSLYVWPGTFAFVTSGTAKDEDLTTSAEDGQKFFQAKYNAIKPGSLVLAKKAVGTSSYVTLQKGVDYFVNEGTGQIEIVDPGLTKGDALRIIQYDYYTGFIKFIQEVVNGLVSDPVSYPGIRAAGVKVLVQAPRKFTMPPIRLAIQVAPGYKETDVKVEVENAIVNYLQELPIGGDVIYAELVERVMSVEGMYNVQFSTPTSDIIIMEDERIDLDALDILVS